MAVDTSASERPAAAVVLAHAEAGTLAMLIGVRHLEMVAALDMPPAAIARGRAVTAKAAGLSTAELVRRLAVAVKVAEGVAA